MPDIMQGRCRVYCPELERMVLLSLSRPEDPSWYEARAVATWNELRDHIGETSHLHRELGEFGAVSFPDGDPCYFPGTFGVGVGSSSRHQAKPNIDLFRRIRSSERRRYRLLGKVGLYQGLASAHLRSHLEDPRKAQENYRARGRVVLNGRIYETSVQDTRMGLAWQVAWPYDLNISFTKEF